MSSILAIARTDLVRLLRDRSNIFFVFIFPLLLVLLIGVQFGGGVQPELALHVPGDAGPLAQDLVDRLVVDETFEVIREDDPDAVLDAVSTGAAALGVTVPPGYDASLSSGEDVRVGVVTRPDGSGPALQAIVDAAVAEQAAVVGAARVAADRTGLPFAQALTQARTVDGLIPGVEVVTSTVGESAFEELSALGRFDRGASSQLLLFVFLTSLAGSSSLIQSRQWGITRRVMSTPTTATAVVLGTALGRYAIALTQALYIVVGSAVLFDVSWGDPVGAAAVILAFCLVSAAAAMLLGSVLDNDAQAGGLGVFIGLGLAALGGSMAPMEVFPDTMKRVGHLVTPHAWGNDAFTALGQPGAGVGDVVTELVVLTAVGVILLVVSGVALHRVTTR